MNTKLFRIDPFVKVWEIAQTDLGYRIIKSTDDTELFDYYVKIGRKIWFLKPRKNKKGHIVLNMDKVTDSSWHGLEFGGQLEVFEIAKALFEINGRLSDTYDCIDEAMSNFCMDHIWKIYILKLEALAKFETRRCVKPWSVIPRYFLYDNNLPG